MNKILVTLLFVSLVFFASCEKKWETKMMDDNVNSQTQTGDTMIKDDMMMKSNESMSGETMMKKEGQWTEEEMKAMEKDGMMHEGDKMMDTEMKKEDTMMKTWVYTAYDAKLVGKTDKTVLFFHASWCPSCRAADSGISADKIPEGLSILKVDYDNSAELKKKYEVLSQHTFVQIDKEGNMLTKWAGGTKVSDITENLK